MINQKQITSLVASITLFHLLIISTGFSQTKFRKAILYHESTGFIVFNGKDANAPVNTTTVPEQIKIYNSSKNLSGSDSVSMTESWTPYYGSNMWDEWYSKFFLNKELLNSKLSVYPIIIIKSCYPSSDIESDGTAADTTDLTRKSIYNYKFLWRKIIKEMSNYKNNYFVIWTNTPKPVDYTTEANALRSEKFCRWAKDTLAAGIDQFGNMPDNVYIFDFFHIITDEKGVLKPMYHNPDYKEHINGRATDTVAPKLVKEVFDNAIKYELAYKPVKTKKETSDLRGVQNMEKSSKIVYTNLLGKVISSYNQEHTIAANNVLEFVPQRIQSGKQ